MAIKYLSAAVFAASLMISIVPGSALAGDKADANSAAAPDPVVARVNGSEIRRSDLVAAQHGLPAQYRSIPLTAIYPALLDQMIATMLSVQAARAINLDKEAVVRRRIESFEARILEDAYIGRVLAKRVTDEALRARHKELVKTSSGEEEIRARHILVKTKPEAGRIIRQIADGADFGDLARKESTGPSGAKGGDLGFFTRGAMVKPFAEAAFALKIGEVTKIPVQTRFGWHIIKLEQRRTSSVPDFAKSRKRLQAEMSKEVVKQVVAELRRKASIEQFNLDGGPLAPAGIKRVP
jgi:peptidyl-prolyl cis-trans isomerase C